MFKSFFAQPRNIVIPTGPVWDISENLPSRGSWSAEHPPAVFGKLIDS